jgi:photosystem II stability/assembly factor-like uncharacterized protein
MLARSSRAARPHPAGRPVLVAALVAVLIAFSGAGSNAAAGTGALATPGAARARPDADTFPVSAYSGMRWRLVGPFRAGRVLAVAGVPGDPRTFYFGAVDGGVWRSRNAGLTWEPISDGRVSPSIGALAIAPSDSKVIWVGTGEADMRSDITYGDGVYRSTDGGAHWTHLGLEDTRHIGKILVDPRDPDVALVAAMGHAYGPSPERGVYRTTDGGKSWTKTLDRGPEAGAIDLAADPTNPNLVYATLWSMHRPPWSQYPPVQGTGSGLFRSEDGGRTWSPVTGGGFPSRDVGRIGVAVAPGGERVYAIVDAGEEGGLYRSDDGGSTWRRVSDDARVTARGWYFGRVFLDPGDPDVVYLPKVGLYRSTDGGSTFVSIKGSPGGDDYHYLWIDPTETGRMIAGVDQGATLTLDAGHTWSSWYNQPTAQFYHVAVDSAFPYRIYGAQQDAGSIAISNRSDYGGVTFRDWIPPGAGEAGYIAPDPLDPDIVYGGDTYGAVYRWDRRTGQTQTIRPDPASSFGTPFAERKYRFTWTSPIVFDPLDPRTLYLGAQKVLRTRDGGLHWEEVSPDLTGAARGRGGGPGAPADTGRGPLSVENASARGHGVVYSLAPSPLRRGVLWAGTDDGHVQVSTDGGTTWKDVTPPGVRTWSRVSLIEASPWVSAGAYVAVDRHRLDDFSPYIYRTADLGAHWARADSGIPEGAFVRAVRADPARRGLLYAGTERGVYVSFDGGGHWQSLQLNLPTVAVRDLAVAHGDLVAATHGRSFWVLDDLSLLRQLEPGATGDAPYLYRPRATWRIRRNEYHDTPLPPEEPQGENPPAGAILDYRLPAGFSGPVRIDILDAAGDTVRSYSSAEEPFSPAAPTYFEAHWLPRSEIPGTAAGHHRLVWDLRWAPPPTAARDYSISAVAGRGTVMEPQGPLALPGAYTVRLTAGGRSSEQSLDLVLDPRVHVSDAALRDQLALALQIRDALTQRVRIAGEAGRAAARLDSLLATGKLQRGPASDARRLRVAVQEVLSGLPDGLSSLETAVQSADRAPPAQVREAFEEEAAALARQRARWDALRSRELPALHARLGKDAPR